MNFFSQFFKSYQSLTKSGIVLFVLVVGLCGYSVGVTSGQGVDMSYLVLFLVGLYALSSGSLALNQVQEVSVDRKMERTKTRPVVVGYFSPFQAAFLSCFLILMGLGFLFIVDQRSALVGLATILLYNVVYTYVWKKKWAFGAVPGAIPGALPPVIGYLAHENARIIDPQIFYLFGILFLWQMPHFWILAIKHKQDYERGGIPVLPLMIGKEKTKFHMGLYLICYLALACLAPLYVATGTIGTLLIWLFALMVLLAFFRYLKEEKKWLLFFLLLNFSILVFSMVPAVGVVRFYI